MKNSKLLDWGVYNPDLEWLDRIITKLEINMANIRRSEMSMAGTETGTDAGQSLTEQVCSITNRLEHLCMKVDGLVNRVELPTPKDLGTEAVPEPANVETLGTAIKKLYPLLNRVEQGVEKLQQLI